MSTSRSASLPARGCRLTTPTDVVTARDSLEWYDAAADRRRPRRRGRDPRRPAHPRRRADRAYDQRQSRTRPVAKPGAANAWRRADRQSAAGARRNQPAAKPAATAGAARRRQPRDSRISRVDAQGHVVVWNATDIGRGDYGVYNADTGIVTLLGNVTITRGQDVIRGQYAVVDLNTNVSRMMTVAAQTGRAGAAGRRAVRARRTPHAAGGHPAGGREICGQRPGQTMKPAESPFRSAAGAGDRRAAAAAGRRKSRERAARALVRPAGCRDKVWARASSGGRCCAASTSRSSAARWSGCSDRTAPARPPAFTSSPG